MLLRSSSTPILKSRVSSSTEASPAEKRARSVCFSTASFRFPVTGAVVSPEKRRPISRCSSSPIESLLLGGGGSESNGQGSDSERTDAYYQKMIEANPGNGLLLGNYARFLKDVQGDLDRAEEYCERAILANPSDGNVLSLYAGLIWQNQNDSSRAENYFNQAVKTAPDDCYVLASYARFLWDVGEEDKEDDKDQETERSYTSTPKFFKEASLRPPLAAA